MSLNAATIEYLLDKGLTGEDLLEVARRSEMRSDPTATERKRKQRAKEKNGMSRRDVTRDRVSNDIDNSNLPVPPVISNEMTSPAASDEQPEPEEPEKLKPEHVIEAWNELAERLGLPVVKKLTTARNRQLASRIRQNTIEDFQTALGAIERSQFLRGENDRGWRADFDFLLQPKSFTKLIEGAYDH